MLSRLLAKFAAKLSPNHSQPLTLPPSSPDRAPRAEPSQPVICFICGGPYKTLAGMFFDQHFVCYQDVQLIMRQHIGALSWERGVKIAAEKHRDGKS